MGMVPCTNNQGGFTLIELVVVTSLLVLVAAISITGFRNFAGFQQYNQAVSDVEFLLNQTRLSARSAEGDESHGIKFATSSTTVFTGDVYDSLDAANEVTTYQLITLEANLTGGTDEIIFSKLTGLPSATGTIVVTGTTFAASTTLEITDTGVIQ